MWLQGRGREGCRRWLREWVEGFFQIVLRDI